LLPPQQPPLLPPLLPTQCCLKEPSPLPLLLVLQGDCLSPLWKLLAASPWGAVEVVLSLT
jgi:hypothetical protein